MILALAGNVSDSGDYTCTVEAALNGKTATASDMVTITITQATQSISYADETITKVVGAENFTNELTKTLVYGDVTYASDNQSVATVNEATGEVAINGAGTATITATAAGSENYTAATASYTITVDAAENTEP